MSYSVEGAAICAGLANNLDRIIAELKKQVEALQALRAEKIRLLWERQQLVFDANPLDEAMLELENVCACCPQDHGPGQSP